MARIKLPGKHDVPGSKAGQRDQQRQADHEGACSGRHQADTAGSEQDHRRQDLEKVAREESPSRCDGEE